MCLLDDRLTVCGLSVENSNSRSLVIDSKRVSNAPTFTPNGAIGLIPGALKSSGLPMHTIILPSLISSFVICPPSLIGRWTGLLTIGVAAIRAMIATFYRFGCLFGWRPFAINRDTEADMTVPPSFSIISFLYPIRTLCILDSFRSNAWRFWLIHPSQKAAWRAN